MASSIRVGLLDWDVHVRAGRRMILDSAKGIEVVFEGRGDLSEIEQVQENLIDVLVIEQRLGSVSGTDFVSLLREKVSDLADFPPCLITAPYQTDALRLEAFEAGAFDAISLESGPEGLLASIKGASENKSHLTLGSLRTLILNVKPEPRIDQAFLQLIASLGEETKRAIDRFKKNYLSDSDSQLSRLGLNEQLKVLGCKYLPELVIKLYRNGLLNGD